MSGAAALRLLAYWLSLAFIFSIPWEDALHVGAIGRISKAFGLAVGAVWVLSIVRGARVRRPGRVQKAYFAFLIWSGLTFFWSLDPRASLGGAMTYTQLFVMMLVIWDLFRDERAVIAGLQAYVFGAFISASSIIVNYATAPTERFTQHQRFAGLGFEVDGIALIVTIASAAAWFLATSPSSAERPGWLRWVNFAYIPMAFFALILTGTRGAAIASIPTGLLILWSLRRLDRGTRLIGIAVLGVAIVLVAALAPRGMLERIGSAVQEVTGGASASAEWGVGEIGGRAVTWGESFQAFSDHPVQGIGVDAHRAAVSANKEAHNIYLSVLTEIGVVGFFLFARLLWAIAATVRRYVGWDRAYWWAQLAILVIGGMTLSLEDSKSIWLFVSLSVAAAPLARGATILTRRERAAASPGATRTQADGSRRR